MPKAMTSTLHLIIGLLTVLMAYSQTDQCDCDDDYGSPFCDEIHNKLAISLHLRRKF